MRLTYPLRNEKRVVQWSGRFAAFYSRRFFISLRQAKVFKSLVSWSFKKAGPILNSYICNVNVGGLGTKT